MNFYDAIVECGYGKMVKDSYLTMKIDGNKVQVTSNRNLEKFGDGGWVEIGSLCCKIDTLTDWKVVE